MDTLPKTIGQNSHHPFAPNPEYAKMNMISQATIDAIKADEFARKTIEAAKTIIYIDGRDWRTPSRPHPNTFITASVLSCG